MATHAGMTTEEFDKIVTRLDRQRASIRRPAGSTPRWSTSRCWSCLPICAPTASRPSSSPAAASSSCARGRRRSTASRPSRSSAAAARPSSRCATATPVLMRLPEINFIDDKAGKPVGIQQHIGRRPIAAFGNSDGDLQMLQWTCAGAGPRFCLYVHHTDAEREWAYDRQSSIGRLDKGLDAAADSGWTVVDMKNDWKKVFAFEKWSMSERGIAFGTSVAPSTFRPLWSLALGCWRHALAFRLQGASNPWFDPHRDRGRLQRPSPPCAQSSCRLRVGNWIRMLVPGDGAHHHPRKYGRSLFLGAR